MIKMNSKEKTILIIGNAGFIGNYFYDYYISKPNVNVYGFDLKNTNSKNTFESDITNYSQIEERTSV